MKIEELRLGNFVTVKNYIQSDYTIKPTDTKVTHIGLNEKIVYKWIGTGEECYYSINDCKAIPLTEEWLVKFGFRWNDRYRAYHLEGDRNKEMIITGNKDKMYVCDMDFHPSIKHVHQLQNLYYALTSEELAIKQPNI